jgi:hypothetical protein
VPLVFRASTRRFEWWTLLVRHCQPGKPGQKTLPCAILDRNPFRGQKTSHLGSFCLESVLGTTLTRDFSKTVSVSRNCPSLERTPSPSTESSLAHELLETATFFSASPASRHFNVMAIQLDLK